VRWPRRPARSPGSSPLFACHDAWKPYDSYGGVAGHALCGAHLLRELIAVTETGTADDVLWAQQAIDALLAQKEAAGTARDAGRGTIDPEILEKQCRWFREAADAGIVLNTVRRSKLQKKRNALATRMLARSLTASGRSELRKSTAATVNAP
jgi:hypothetical protein